LLHVTVVAVATGCLIAAWWQVGRARSGNWLSYAYAVEWPAFAVVAVIGWWQLVHDDREAIRARKADREAARAADQLAHRRARRVEDESPELRAYNDYLQTLAVRNARKTWRKPRGA
jgi:DNA-binding transcriptional regulator of glucitol operon